MGFTVSHGFKGRLPGRAVLAGLLLVLVAGCASVRPLPPRPERSNIPAFTLDGRISVRQGERPYASRIEWTHAADSDRIFLVGPLGQGLAELSRDSAGARLVTAERKTLTAPDWSALAEDLLGIPLPLSGVVRWIAGAVEPTARDAMGRPQTALEQGWVIRYVEYESTAADALPVQIELTRDDIDVRIRIDQWQLQTP